MVGLAQLVEHRIVVPGVVGSSPISHPFYWIEQTSLYHETVGRGVSGNTPDFDSVIVGSSPAVPAFIPAPVAQQVEHRPFKAGVRGSSPRWSTSKKRTDF